MTKLFQIRCSQRKQTKNLNVNSPAPEMSINFYKKSDATKYKKEKLKEYHKCEMGVIK